ncbi:MAG: hypothetical protein JWP20_1180, partial [Roseomonas sp.]|nr:hypothetical protein [Roseomonas sp.]
MVKAGPSSLLYNGFISLAFPPARRLAFLPDALRRIPHLPAFWPEHVPDQREAGLLALPEGARPPRGTAQALLRYAAGPLRAPAFGRRTTAVALLLADDMAPCLGLAPLAPPPPVEAKATHRAAAAAAFLAEARIGGEPGLPDPGAAFLRLPRRGAVVVLDPCCPGRASAGH